jgi:hypothetical protein
MLVVLLLILPFSVGRPGTAGPAGLAAAAAICLLAGWASEAVACYVLATRTPLVRMLVGMAIRMLPPLAVCLALAAQGASGRQHLPFVCYLLTFYLVTLALETWLAVGRAARWPSESIQNAR